MAAKRTVNISPAERVTRMLLGVLGTGVGVYLLTVATGALGHFSLYAKLGHVPAPLKGRNS